MLSLSSKFTPLITPLTVHVDLFATGQQTTKVRELKPKRYTVHGLSASVTLAKEGKTLDDSQKTN